MVINEQIRLYNEKMEEIEQLEYAEALAVNQLKLKRQNTVRRWTPNTNPCADDLFLFFFYNIVPRPCDLTKAKSDHLVDEVSVIMNEVHGVALLLFLDGNVANVPCLSLALLAFTSQVLSSLQRSGGMYHCALPVQ